MDKPSGHFMSIKSLEKHKKALYKSLKKDSYKAFFH